VLDGRVEPKPSNCGYYTGLALLRGLLDLLLHRLHSEPIDFFIN
jgi:hypothetical protein